MAESPINPMIRGWLESGRGVDALLGRGRYFIPTPTYGEHDRILVVGEILDWAAEGHASQGASDLKQAIENLIGVGAVGDAADVLLAYTIAAKGRLANRDGPAQLLPLGWMQDALQRIRVGQARQADRLNGAIGALAGPEPTDPPSRDIRER